MVCPKRPILVTGAAGFIGAALVQKLVSINEDVIGIDNLNSYYDQKLKKARLTEIQKNLSSKTGSWKFFFNSLEDREKLNNIFRDHSPRIVVNLAAQAGVRYSLENPSAYIQSNLVGFSNLLEVSRYSDIEHFLYASSSSVYGGNQKLPFCESDQVNHPVSLYAATKKANELMAHSYSHLFDIPSTGLRFFTVYGPWGRPDMAPMLFARAILGREPIKVFNYGKMKRDFTYIEDIVEAVTRCCFKIPFSDNHFDTLNPNAATSLAPHRIFNIGNSQSIELLYFIEVLEKYLGVKAIKDLQPIQPGDVPSTAAETNLLEDWIGFRPKTSIENGLMKFSKWYKDFYSF